MQGHLQRHSHRCDESGERKEHEAREAGELVGTVAVRVVHREDGESGQDGLQRTSDCLCYAEI